MTLGRVCIQCPKIVHSTTTTLGSGEMGGFDVIGCTKVVLSGPIVRLLCDMLNKTNRRRNGLRKMPGKKGKPTRTDDYLCT